MWPKRMWMTYEHIIRNAAGMGKAPTENDPDIYDKTHAHCDVLVVGTGAAGLSAALAAARTGARVIVADEQPTAGGSLLSRRIQLDDEPASAWVDAAVSELESLDNVTPADVYYRRDEKIISKRDVIKQKTLKSRREYNLKKEGNKKHLELPKLSLSF